MANYNKVILVGNLTRDPELRYTSKGLAIAKLSLAVNRTYRNESGETKEETTFVDIDSFGKQAETLANYLKKGRSVLVEGRLRLDQWEDKQSGQKRSRLGVVLEGFQFLGPRPEGAGEAAPQPRSSSPAAASEPDGPPPEEDDVPF